MASNILAQTGSVATLVSTEANSLANNAAALGAEYDNSGASNLFLYGLFLLTVTFGSNPTAGNTVDLYLIPAIDGTNYSDNVTGASGAAPSTSFVGSFPLRAVTTIQRVPLGLGIREKISIPPTKFKAFIINKSGVAFPSSGSTLTMLPYRLQTT